MNRIIQKTSIYNLGNLLISGFILAFEVYYLIPESFQNLFTSNTIVWIFSYILFSLLFGLLNDSLSEYVIMIYENDKLMTLLKKLLHWLIDKWNRLTNKNYAQLWNSVVDKLHLSVNDEKDDEIIEQENNIELFEEENVVQEDTDELAKDYVESLETDQNIEEAAEATAETKDIEERVYKKTADGKADLYDYVQNYYLPRVFKDSTNSEIDEYVYLFLLNSSIHHRLNESMASQSLIKNLCSLCVLSAGMALFMHISDLLIVSIIYKIVVIFLLILLGYIFHQEYLQANSKFKRYNLIWYVQLKEDPKYAKEMGFDSLFKKENN